MIGTTARRRRSLLSKTEVRLEDYGPEAFLHTLKLLDQNGIAFVGGGKDLPSAQKPVFLERKGYRVGFLAYASYFDKGFEAAETHPGLSPVRVDPLYAPPHVNEEDLHDMIAAINETNAQADVVMVSHHWGELRFARVEITKEQFEEMKRTLE